MDLGRNRAGWVAPTSSQQQQQQERPEYTVDRIGSFALSSISQDRDGVNTRFFSEPNLDLLQNQMAEALRSMGYNITRQDDASLIIIMRRVYADNAVNNLGSEDRQVVGLNKKVLDICVPMIVDGIKMRMTYLRDVSTLPVPLDRSSNESSMGTKAGVLNPGF